MKEVKPWVRPALEYGPLILFFAVFMVMRSRTVMLGGTEYGGFIVATMIFVPVLALTTFALWRLTGKVSAMQLLTLVLVVVFGGLTIWLNDERFLKMKVTIIYAIFAGLLSLGLVLRKNWLATGATLKEDRPRALDLLGFRSQLVFNTFANSAGSLTGQSFCGARRMCAPLAPPRMSVSR